MFDQANDLYLSPDAASQGFTCRSILEACPHISESPAASVEMSNRGVSRGRWGDSGLSVFLS